MTESDRAEANKQTVRRIVAEGVNRANLEVFREAVTEDYVRHSQASTGMEEIRGAEAFLQFLEWNYTAFPDWHEEIEVILAENDLVAYVTTGTGTHVGPMGEVQPTGRQIRLHNFVVHRFEGGKIAETWVGWDNLAALKQLGLLQPQPDG
jgi:predicted ester cyclase